MCEEKLFTEGMVKPLGMGVMDGVCDLGRTGEPIETPGPSTCIVSSPWMGEPALLPATEVDSLTSCSEPEMDSCPIPLVAGGDGRVGDPCWGMAGIVGVIGGRITPAEGSLVDGTPCGGGMILVAMFAVEAEDDVEVEDPFK